MHDERNPGHIQDGRLVGGVGLGIGGRSGIDRGVYIVLGPPAFGHPATTTGGGATVVKSIYRKSVYPVPALHPGPVQRNEMGSG